MSRDDSIISLINYWNEEEATKSQISNFNSFDLSQPSNKFAQNKLAPNGPKGLIDENSRESDE